MEPIYFEQGSRAAPVFIILLTMFVVLVSLIAIAIKVRQHRRKRSEFSPHFLAARNLR